MLGIKVSKIENENLKELEGYMWKTDKETKEKFELEKENEVGFAEGNICLDLVEGDNQTILDTITISEERFTEIRGN